VTTTYYVTETVSDCESPSTSVTITVNSLPLINTTSMVVDSSSCGNSDGSITGITATGTGTLTYQWDDPGSQTTLDAIGLAVGTYTLTVTGANGCTAIEIVNMPCGLTGIEEYSLANSLQLYPNPTTGKILLEFALDKPKDIKVTVYNILGEVVSVTEWKDVATETYRMNLSGITNGIYYLNIQTDNEIIVKKVSVVR